MTRWRRTLHGVLSVYDWQLVTGDWYKRGKRTAH
jgi:hypothetical protein